MLTVKGVVIVTVISMIGICFVFVGAYHIYDLLKGNSKCKNEWLGFIHDWPA